MESPAEFDGSEYPGDACHDAYASRVLCSSNDDVKPFVVVVVVDAHPALLVAGVIGNSQSPDRFRRHVVMTPATLLTVSSRRSPPYTPDDDRTGQSARTLAFQQFTPTPFPNAKWFMSVAIDNFVNMASFSRFLPGFWPHASMAEFFRQHKDKDGQHDQETCDRS
ncbi:unnamed protein product [Soboliphyme baturini]|uniref:DDE_Tnp_1_7 domain-containing protein n=1 Tax=Soboliphyme baturini TaxID=241478 RepID=A0A183IVV9_9BILA|nr:unnamed protein product [Soboliphyme baturini]